MTQISPKLHLREVARRRRAFPAGGKIVFWAFHFRDATTTLSYLIREHASLCERSVVLHTLNCLPVYLCPELLALACVCASSALLICAEFVSVPYQLHSTKFQKNNHNFAFEINSNLGSGPKSQNQINFWSKYFTKSEMSEDLICQYSTSILHGSYECKTTLYIFHPRRCRTWTTSTWISWRRSSRMRPPEPPTSRPRPRQRALATAASKSGGRTPSSACAATMHARDPDAHFTILFLYTVLADKIFGTKY